MTKKDRTALMVAVAGAIAARHLSSMLTLFVSDKDGDEAIDIISALAGKEPESRNVHRDAEGDGGNIVYHWHGAGHLDLQVQYRVLPSEGSAP